MMMELQIRVLVVGCPVKFHIPSIELPVGHLQSQISIDGCGMLPK